MTSTVTKNNITLCGSAQIIAEYLNFGMNSILFQRGIYPAETFKSVQQYGLTILMSTDPKIEQFIKNVLAQTTEWLAKNEIEKISMIITNANTKETIECWDFKVQSEAGDGTGSKNPTSSKDLKKIQGEIRDVMRQIAATVSYLPLLECICSFDVLIYMREPNCEVPKEWNETEGVHIKNAQQVQLKTFSTGLHKVETIVNYKMTD